MTTLGELKAKVSAEVRTLFDFLWQEYLRTGKWPTSRVLLGRWDKARLIDLLAPLSGAMVMETESGGTPVYELRFLGILCTADGEEYLRLLSRYLEFLRDIFYNQQEREVVTNSDAMEALKLSVSETGLLGRLIFSGFLPVSGSFSPNFDRWEMALPRALEDVPRSGPISDPLNRILEAASRVSLKVFLRDRVAQSSAPSAIDEDVAEFSIGGKRVPVVFISYSHDSKEHKMWVLEFAQQLRRHGIDVKLDQWDLAYGEYVPKFMEHWVTEAERVLMICTEPYVRKVDDGKGGAGYEAMIVTAELIQDLGTKKFIPVIRQAGGNIVLPKCLGIRFAANLSVGANAEEEFTKLIEQLRQIPPPSKPPIGSSLSPSSLPVLPTLPAVESFSNDPQKAYKEALALARSGDLVTWRKLMAEKKTAIVHRFDASQKSNRGSIGEEEAVSATNVRSSLEAFEPLFAIAIAGVESGQPRFCQQASLIYDLIEAPAFERTGSPVVVLPEAAAFTFQAILGAMTVYSTQNFLTLELATQRVVDSYPSRDSGPLFANHPLVGWPKAFDTKCTPAWNYLIGLPDFWPWLELAFGSKGSFRESLCGYYVVLSWLEFVEYLRLNPELDESQDLRFDVPPLFLRCNEQNGGVRRVLQDREPLQRYTNKIGVDPVRQEAAWPKWVTIGVRSLHYVYEHRYLDTPRREELIHFAADLHRVS